MNEEGYKKIGEILGLAFQAAYKHQNNAQMRVAINMNNYKPDNVLNHSDTIKKEFGRDKKRFLDFLNQLRNYIGEAYIFERFETPYGSLQFQMEGSLRGKEFHLDTEIFKTVKDSSKEITKCFDGSVICLNEEIFYKEHDSKWSRNWKYTVGAKHCLLYNFFKEHIAEIDLYVEDEGGAWEIILGDKLGSDLLVTLGYDRGVLNLYPDGITILKIAMDKLTISSTYTNLQETNKNNEIKYDLEMNFLFDFKLKKKVIKKPNI